MKQRLGLANALLSPRDLLVLDEPTNGLDPQGTREVRNLIRSLADDGTTVFVSSHLLAEIEQVCTHAAVMRTGKIVAQGPLDELRAAGARTVTVRTPDVGQAGSVLTRLGLTPRHDGGADVLVADLPHELLPETITAELVRADVRVRGLTVGRRHPRGPVRRTHRRGIRCRSLTRPSRRPHSARRPPRRQRPFALLGSELALVFRRRRTWAMLGALALVPILIAVAVRLTTDGDAGGPGVPRRHHQQRPVRGVHRADGVDPAVPAAHRRRGRR